MVKRKIKSKASGVARARNDVPEVYREMLADFAISSPSQRGEEGRVVKRRRVGGRIITQMNDQAASYHSDHSNQSQENADLDELFEDAPVARQQIQESDSEDSGASDFNWEEVDLGVHVDDDENLDGEATNDAELNLVLLDSEQQRTIIDRQRAKRKLITVAEKALRLEVHKMFLCCLLTHVHIRNHWCNDDQIQVRFVDVKRELRH